MNEISRNTGQTRTTLAAVLHATRRRLRQQEGLKLIWRALGVGLAATLLLVALGRIRPLAWPGVLALIGAGFTLMGLLAALAYAWLRPRPEIAVARLLDRRLGLDERLSTALELMAGRHAVPAQILRAQLADTQAHLAAFEPALAFPLRRDRRWLALAGLLAAAILLGLFAPNPQLSVLEERAQTQALIEEQVAQLEQIRAEVLADELLPETPQGQELLQTLDELIATLQEGDLSREEALAALSEAEQSLAALQDLAGRQTGTLNELAQTFSRFDSTAELAEALRQRDLARAAEALASAGNNLPSDPQSGQELAEALRQAAEIARQGGDAGLADALEQAAGALEQAAAEGDPQAARDALARAAEALQQADGAALAEALANIQAAREALAQGGGGEGSGQGQEAGSEQGQGAGAGAVAGQGESVGGSGREDPGPGAEGLTASEGAPDRMATDNGPNEGRTGAYEPVYAPTHLGGEGGPLVNPDAPDVEGGVPLGDATVDPNQDPGAALVPYNEVYGQYVDSAGQALDSSYIPLGMKGYIRQYFGALEPKN